MEKYASAFSPPNVSWRILRRCTSFGCGAIVCPTWNGTAKYNPALINPATAQKIGQMSGCDIIIVGSIQDQGQFVVINARMLETSSGKALAAERVEMRKIPISRT
jgi:hypothetical protein